MSTHSSHHAISEDLLTELSRAHLTASLCAERLQQELAHLNGLPAAGADGWPMVDPGRHCVRWAGHVCHLGPTAAYRLITLFLRQPGRDVSHEQLLRQVWHGQRRSPATVRSAIRLLRDKLREAHMPRLAAAIRGRGCHYGLILDRLEA